MLIEKLEKNEIKVTFDVTLNEFELYLDQAYDLIKDRVEISGFRKGHAPKSSYINKYGVESLFQDAVNACISDKFEGLLISRQAEVVSEPTKVEFIPEQPNFTKEEFKLVLYIPVKPEVKLGQYKGLEIPKKEYKVTDEQINQVIEQEILSKTVSQELKENQVVENGDVAVFDFEGFLDGVAFEGGKAEKYSLVIGSGQFIPGFEEQLLGMKKDEERTIKVKFPEQYHAENLKGKDVEFKILMHEVKIEKKEQLSDELVSKYTSFKTVEEYKKHVVEKLTIQNQHEYENYVEQMAVLKASDNAVIDIPEAMVLRDVEHQIKQTEQSMKQYGLSLESYLQMQGKTLSEYKEDLKRQSYERIHQVLTLEAIAKAENITVTDEEISQKIKEYAIEYKVTEDEMKQRLNGVDLSNNIKIEKAVDFIKLNSKLV